MTNSSPAPIVKTPGHSKHPLTALSLLSLIGVGAAVSASQTYYEIRGGTAGFKSFCNISSQMNCSAVASSRFAELFPGLPLSSVVAGWFVALFLFSIFARSTGWRREAVRLSLAFTAFGAVCSVFYFIVMAAFLKTFCLMCLVIDGVNFAALGLLLYLKPRSPDLQPTEKGQWKTLLGTAAACVFAAVIFLKAFDTLPISNADVQEIADATLNSTQLSVNTADEFPSIGPKNAPITIVEFSDFQCPFCKNGANVLNAVIQRYPDKVRLVFRNYPLDPSCNRRVPSGMHAFACEAARVGVCANKQGKFEETYKTLFENQSSFATGKPAELGVKAGLDEAVLKGCVADPTTNASIGKDIEEGTVLGVNTTPTFFINGHRIEGAYPVPVWNRIVDSLLNQQPH